MCYLDPYRKKFADLCFKQMENLGQFLTNRYTEVTLMFLLLLKWEGEIKRNFIMFWVSVVSIN